MKKITALFIAMFMVVATFVPTANAFSKTEVWSGDIASSFESGDGSISSPFIIAKANQLALLADLVNSGEGNYASLSYVVGMPIVLNGATASNTWIPIGTTEHPFRGYFDGCDYSISKAYNNSGTSYLGLFGVVDNANISYVYMRSTYFYGDEYIGAIVGQATDSIIENCKFQGEVGGNSCVGGIAGAAYESELSKCVSNLSSFVVGYDAHTGGIAGDSSSYINASKNYAAVGGQDFVGGIVGFNLYNGLVKLSVNAGSVNGYNSVGGVVGCNMGHIIHCTNEKSPSGTGNLGGICGDNILYGVVSDCMNHAEIWNDSASATNVGGIVGNNNSAVIMQSINLGNILKSNSGGNVGGIVGQSFKGRITECVNSVYVTSDFDSSIVGGIVGKTNYDTILRCQNSGNISGVDMSDTSRVGGIAGDNFSLISNSFNKGSIFGGRNLGGITGRNNATIENSYNAGNIEEILGAGSITGLNDSEGFIDNCYYLDTTIGFSLSNFGTELTDSQMQTQESFYGFDFPGVWTMSVDGYLYPILNINAICVEILRETDSLEVGESTQLTAIVTPITAINREVEWSVSSDVATIDEFGVLVAMKPGYVNAKAQCGNVFAEVGFDIYQYHTVSFFDSYANETFSQLKVLHGDVVTVFPDAPTHEHQHFAGWDYDNEPIYEDTVISALYELSKYNVSFVDGVTGLEFENISVDAGTILSVLPDVPTHEGYEFKGWDYDGEPINNDTVITAEYNVIPYYEVTFRDGVTLEDILVISVRENTVIFDFPKVPTHAGYEFKGWDYDGEPINNDTVITAEYDEIIYHTVTFRDGVTLQDFFVISVRENTVITEFPEAPTHSRYEFSHWDYNGLPVTADILITAVYEEKTYHTVTFVDGLTGEEISQILVESGKTISEFPTPSEHFGYEFDKWDYDSEPIASDTTVTALYIEIYTLGDVNADGNINTGDAVLILKYASGAAALNDLQLLSADFNRDGKVNTGDATSILKALIS
ncbi:MAG: hypothetical protein GX802_04445 [Clostridiales bacterium]|nr:hypothetical protein [Clostridiales bacterium]